jgi:SAM-dependent methyltransferase
VSQDYWDARFRERGRLWGDEPSLAGRRAAAFCRSMRIALEPPGQPLRVLLPGCGYGRNARCLAEDDTQVVAVDSSPAALALTVPHPHVTYVRADATALPFRTAAFDAVIALHLFHLLDVEERRRACREWRRLCRRGAMLAVSVFAVEDADWGRGDCVEPDTWQREDGKRTHFFTEEALREAFSAFQITEVDRCNETDSSGPRRYLWLTAIAT